MKIKKLAALCLAAACSMTVLAGCASKDTTPDEPKYQIGEVTINEEEDFETEKPEPIEGPVKVALIKGPTALGASEFLHENDHGTVYGDFEFQLYSSPDEVTGKIINGEIHAAAVPTNVASVLYNKTEGEIVVAAINTFGTLFIVENGNSVSSFEDLAGKEIVSAGQGAVPEYVLQYILNKSGVEDVTVNFVSNHNEAATALAAGEADVALLPEPFVSVATSKNANLNIALSIAEEWDKYSYKESGVPNTLPMGCIVVRKDYLETNERMFKEFLNEYEFFVDKSVEDIALTAEYAAEYEIVASAAIAEKAIPNCGIAYVDDAKMMRLMDNFLNIMNEANPKSIGGKVPGEDFYYIR